ncbi:MAG: hypothetical protein ACE5I7_18445, partial [Candidatus Binatia bacterium]
MTMIPTATGLPGAAAPVAVFEEGRLAGFGGAKAAGVRAGADAAEVEPVGVPAGLDGPVGREAAAAVVAAGD